MKTTRIISSSTLALGLALALTGTGYAADAKPTDTTAKESVKTAKETVVAWNDVPSAVRTTITAEAKGGKVETVAMVTKKDHVFYTAKVLLTNGKETTIRTDAAGQLVKHEHKPAAEHPGT